MTYASARAQQLTSGATAATAAWATFVLGSLVVPVVCSSMASSTPSAEVADALRAAVPISGTFASVLLLLIALTTTRIRGQAINVWVACTLSTMSALFVWALVLVPTPS